MGLLENLWVGFQSNNIFPWKPFKSTKNVFLLWEEFLLLDHHGKQGDLLTTTTGNYYSNDIFVHSHVKSSPSYHPSIRWTYKNNVPHSTKHPRQKV